MALGGGIFQLQNKTVPGAYINFVSVGGASVSLSERGIATMPIVLPWGAPGVLDVTQEDLWRRCREIFGYSYSAPELRPIRELFLHCRRAYLYRLNGGGLKATSALCTAVCAGTRGNDIKYSVAASPDVSGGYVVSIYLDSVLVDSQTVTQISELKDNNFVTFNDGAALEAVASVSLSGGTDSTVTGDDYSAYLAAVEGYAFNTMGVDTTDNTIKALVLAYAKRMREQVGKKFQVVLYNSAADYEGVINLMTGVSNAGASAAALVPWLTGASAGCAVNASLLNTLYDGEYDVNPALTQAQIELVEGGGTFVFHNVNGRPRVLHDQNSLTTITTDKNELFQDNKVIRICDQIANDIAALFAERYLGVTPNDNAGRIALWSDVVDYMKNLQALRAIQNFDSEDVTVEQGDQKDAVLVTVAIEVTGTMAKLYMIVQIS